MWFLRIFLVALGLSYNFPFHRFLISYFDFFTSCSSGKIDFESFLVLSRPQLTDAPLQLRKKTFSRSSNLPGIYNRWPSASKQKHLPPSTTFPSSQLLENVIKCVGEYANQIKTRCLCWWVQRISLKKLFFLLLFIFH